MMCAVWKDASDLLSVEKARMKVLIVNDFDQRVGGVETYCHRLETLLRDAGYQVRYVGGTYTKDMLKRFVSSLANFEFVRRIKKELKEFEPDIVHVHSISANVSPLFMRAIKRRNIPIVMTVHGFSHYVCPQLWMMQETKYRCETGFAIRCLGLKCHPDMGLLPRVMFFGRTWVHRRSIRKYVDVFVAPSRILGDYLTRNLGVREVWVVPLYVDTRNGEVLRRETPGQSILSVGRLSKEKGLEYLIAAIPQIAKVCPEVQLHIVGEGRRTCLEEYAAKLGEDVRRRVFFHGYIGNNQELRKFYNEASVFVLPSVCMEAFGLTLLEAMSNGVPVITTNIGGQAELVQPGFNGVLVRPRDSGQLADTLIGLLNNPDALSKLSVNAFEYAQGFDSRHHLCQINDIYRSALVAHDKMLEDDASND
jgi:glycosyltransferase involved in cell wall biosynthesis